MIRYDISILKMICRYFRGCYS